jgi:hypothetical protein
MVRTWGEAYGENLRLAVCQIEAWPLPEKFETNELFSGRITKTFLLSIPAGDWLYLQGYPQQFDEMITERTDCQRLWEKMIEAGRSNFQRYVLWSEGDVEAIRSC